MQDFSNVQWKKTKGFSLPFFIIYVFDKIIKIQKRNDNEWNPSIKKNSNI